MYLGITLCCTAAVWAVIFAIIHAVQADWQGALTFLVIALINANIAVDTFRRID